jgi:hypothetical protein
MRSLAQLNEPKRSAIEDFAGRAELNPSIADDVKEIIALLLSISDHRTMLDTMTKIQGRPDIRLVYQCVGCHEIIPYSPNKHKCYEQFEGVN